MEATLEINTNSDTWDQFLAHSPQSNVFATSGFLSCYEEHIEYAYLVDKGHPLLGLAVLKNKNGIITKAPIQLGQYQQTIVCGRELTNGLPHSIVKHYLESCSVFLDLLAKKYGSIALFLHHSLCDIRPLQWLNYNEPEKGQFKISTNYTGLIELDKNKGFSVFLNEIRRTRKQEYASAIKSGLQVQINQSIDVLIDLYEATFARQNIVVTDDQNRLVRNIFNFALKHNSGRSLVCLDANNNCMAATLFLHDKKAAYYLIGANAPDSRSAKAGPFLFLENVKHYFETEVGVIDVVGMNSPNRGDFKTSFNAIPKPYFLGNLLEFK